MAAVSLFSDSYLRYIRNLQNQVRQKEMKEITTETVALQEEEPQNTIEPVAQIAEEASPDAHPIELNIDPKRHEEIRSSYKDEQDKGK